MVKRFILSILTLLNLLSPALELYAEKQTPKHARVTKQPSDTRNEQSTIQNQKSEQQASPTTQEEADDTTKQCPTMSETWGKVFRLQWTSLDQQDAQNIGITLLLCAAAGYGVHKISTYEFAPRRYIPDYYPSFMNTSISCDICFNDTIPRDQKKLSCGHAYCTACIVYYIDCALGEKSTANMRCPDPDCMRRLSPAEVKYILNDDSHKMDTYYTIRLNEYNVRHHYTRSAIDPASAAWVKNNTKRCPGCKADIEKNEGCNHMTCSRCKHEFCWVCLANWRYAVVRHDSYYTCPTEAASNTFGAW